MRTSGWWCCSPNGPRSLSTTPACTRPPSVAGPSSSAPCEGLQATVSLAREVGGETELERVLELVVKRGRALVEARLFLALLPGPDGLVVADAAGEVPADLLGRAVELDRSLLEPGQRSGGARPGPAVRELLAGLGIEVAAVLLAPLVHRGRPVGMLAALDRLDGEGFSADDELLLSSFATSAATAVAMVRAVESDRLRLSISASERERRRWARELHDDTLQQLGALKVLHDTALLRGEEDVMRRSLERATEQLHETISGLEGLITELRPSALDQLGIAAALEALIDRAERTSQIRSAPTSITSSTTARRASRPSSRRPSIASSRKRSTT